MNTDTTHTVPHRGMITVSIMLATIMQALDTTIANVALPHRAEARVNPATEMRNTYLMPKCPASQPVSGIMMAAETMYEVRTQATWFCEADSAPWICGRATLAIVLSTPCMIVASMIDTVMRARLPPAACSPPLTASPPYVNFPLRPSGGEGGARREAMGG